MKNLLVAAAVSLGLAGCGMFPNAHTIPDAVLTLDMALCVYDHSSDPVLLIMQECNIPETLLKDVVDAQATATAHKAAAAKGAKHCAGDGGSCK